MHACRFGVLTTCAAAIVLTSLQSALAADAAAPRAPWPGPVFNWTGLYFGGQIGVDFATARYVRPQASVSDISIGSANRRLDGGIYGGVNYQVLPWLVVGAEGELTSLSANYRELGPNIDFLQFSKYQADVAARVGIVIMPATMVYAKAGPAWIDVRGFESFGTRFQKTIPAELVAAGIETLVTPNLALRTEASYTRARDLLLLNQAFDQYRPVILQIKFGAAVKLDTPGSGAPASTAETGPLYFKAPSAAPVASAHWTGVEVGGFGSLNGDQMRYFGTFAGENNEQGPYTNLVVGGGGFVGFNAQPWPDVVVGIEASGNFQKADFNVANGVGLATAFFHFASINEVYAVTGRLGWLATPSTLFYFKGGPALIRVTPDSNYWNAIAPNSATQAVTLNAFQYGAGAETFLTPNLSVRVEWLYTGTDGTPGQQVVFKGVQPGPFGLQPSLLSGTLGAALHF